MIDSPLVPSNAVKWRALIAEKGELKYLINSEFHADHTLGNFFFSGTVISHEQTRTLLPKALGSAADVREKIGREYPADVHLVEEYQVNGPSITFADTLRLHLGRHTFELLHLPGHTPGQIGIYVPNERILFTGDNFSNGFRPAVMDSCPLEWLDSLDRILELDVDKIVPGHGEIGNKEDVRKFREFIDNCIGRVREAIGEGMSKEEVVDRVEFEKSLIPRHSGRAREKKDIGRLYDVLWQKQSST